MRFEQRRLVQTLLLSTKYTTLRIHVNRWRREFSPYTRIQQFPGLPLNFVSTCALVLIFNAYFDGVYGVGLLSSGTSELLVHGQSASSSSCIYRSVHSLEFTTIPERVQSLMHKVAYSFLHEGDVIFKSRLNMVSLNLHTSDLLEVNLTLFGRLKLVVQVHDFCGIKHRCYITLLEIIPDRASILKLLGRLIRLNQGFIIFTSSEFLYHNRFLLCVSYVYTW